MRLKPIASIVMGTMLVFSSLPLSALAQEKEEGDSQNGKYDTKDEAVYGNLTANGALKDMYVVNTFHIDKPGMITDHGDYMDVRNLTNLSEMDQDGQEIQFISEKDDDEFYYQGYLEDHPLPWDIDITYLLDGKKINPDELAGKSGSLEIQIETSANEEVDDTFFEYYMLQISLTLDPELFSDIQAPDATKAKEGKDTNVTFTVMPEQEEEFIISTEVTDMEMDPIEISATPASMPIDDPDLGDMKGDMQELTDAIEEINGGVGDLNNGIAELSDGASDLNEGSNGFLNGINELDQSSGELVEGSSEINEVLQQVSDAVQEAPDESIDISDFEQIPDGIRELADGMYETADGLDELREHYDEGYDNLKDAIDDIPDEEISEEELQQLQEQLESEADQEVVAQLIETYQAALKAKGTYDAVKEAFDEVTGTLDEVSSTIREIAENADSTATEIENGLDDMEDLEELGDLQSGLSEMSSEYDSFHQGLVDYTDGVGGLASNYQEIDEGIGDLSEGSSSLEDGAGELKDGTEELEKETSDLPGEMQSEVDEMMEDFDMSDFEPVSFVSDKNKDVDIVQFALQTDSIEIEDADDDESDNEEEDKNLWDRFLDLFR